MKTTAEKLTSGNIGQRLVFIAELLRQGETPDTDKQPLSRQEIEVLRRIAHMLNQATAAAYESRDGAIGLASLAKSVNTLARSLGNYSATRSLGTQAKEIRENARDVEANIGTALQRIGGSTNDGALKQTLLSGMQQLKDLEPKGKAGNRIVRHVTLRSGQSATQQPAAKQAVAAQPAGASVVSFNRTPTPAPRSAESLTPFRPSPLSRPAEGRTALSVLPGALPEAKTTPRVSVASAPSVPKEAPVTVAGKQTTGAEAQSAKKGAIAPNVPSAANADAKATTAPVERTASAEAQRTLPANGTSGTKATTVTPGVAQTEGIQASIAQVTTDSKPLSSPASDTSGTKITGTRTGEVSHVNAETAAASGAAKTDGFKASIAQHTTEGKLSSAPANDTSSAKTTAGQQTGRAADVVSISTATAPNAPAATQPESIKAASAQVEGQRPLPANDQSRRQSGNRRTNGSGG